MFNDFMVDLETTGTSPDRNHVVEIAIIAFNADTMEICPSKFCIQLSKYSQPNRVANPETMDWWMKQNPELRFGVFSNINRKDLDLSQQLEDLRRWVFEVADVNAPKIFWAKPAAFDFPFLQSLFKDARVQFPFAYWLVQDMRSHCLGLIAGKQGCSLQEADKFYNACKPERTDAHSALADVQWQLDWLKAVKEGVKNA